MNTKKRSIIYLVFSIAALCIVISSRFLRPNSEINLFDISTELVLTLFTGLIVVLFQNFKGPMKIYYILSVGFSITFLSYVIDVLDEFYKLPIFVQDDVIHFIALIFISVGVYLWVRHNNSIMQSLQQRACTDALTGAANRQKLECDIEQMRKRVQRYRVSFSMVIFDIDHFKKVNDTFGHTAGDSVLVELTRIVQEQIRDVDFLYRYGGEEFVILLSDTDLSGATATAEKIRQSIEAYRFRYVNTLTASFGVAQYTPDESVESFINRADENLYHVKENGRNSVFPTPKMKQTKIHKMFTMQQQSLDLRYQTV